MVLTPDQKKRIAALDAKPVEAEDEPRSGGKVLSARVKAFTLSARMSSLQPVFVKLLIIIALLGVAGFFVIENQLHKIDFKAVFSSGRGSSVNRLSEAVKVQREKAVLLEKGRGQLLGSKYSEAFKTALEVRQLDAKDPRAEELIDDTVDAVAQKAIQEFESGKIEVALADVRLGLKYRNDHAVANRLYMDIAERLFLEAREHHNKKEYPKLIGKAQEVLRIMPSHMAAHNLLVKANGELQDQAGELFISKRYFESLQMVRLSLRIDGKDTRSLRLLNEITTYVEIPRLELRGIMRRGKVFYARIRYVDSGRWLIKSMKEGDTIKNFKVVDIDSAQKRVELQQIYSGQKFTIQQASPG